MQADWVGISVSVLIILMIFLIIVAKIQGDRVIDVLEQFLDFVKGE